MKYNKKYLVENGDIPESPETQVKKTHEFKISRSSRAKKQFLHSNKTINNNALNNKAKKISEVPSAIIKKEPLLTQMSGLPNI